MCGTGALCGTGAGGFPVVYQCIYTGASWVRSATSLDRNLTCKLVLVSRFEPGGAFDVVGGRAHPTTLSLDEYQLHFFK
jgi:hypothetical protein